MWGQCSCRLVALGGDGYLPNETIWSWSFWSHYAEIEAMPRTTSSHQSDFGRALQQLRAARGVTQEDLQFAISRRHISRIEQGHQQPSVDTIESLAESLQIHPLTLVTAAYCSIDDSAGMAILLQTVQADLAALSCV